MCCESRQLAGLGLPQEEGGIKTQPIRDDLYCSREGDLPALVFREKDGLVLETRLREMQSKAHQQNE